MNKSTILTDFVFDPATGKIDFSGVPGFEPSRVRYVYHRRSGTYLYAKPRPVPTFDEAVLSLVADTSKMGASDDLLVLYDPPATT